MKNTFTISLILIMLSFHSYSQNLDEWNAYTYGGNIHAIVQQGDILWLGTSGGLVKFNKTNGEKTFFNTANSGIKFTQIHSLALDKNGILWISHFSGIIRLR